MYYESSPTSMYDRVFQNFFIIILKTLLCLFNSLAPEAISKFFIPTPEADKPFQLFSPWSNMAVHGGLQISLHLTS